MNKLKQDYESPVATVVGLHSEGMICDSPWYKKGGQGNFSYEVEEEDEFA